MRSRLLPFAATSVLTLLAAVPAQAQFQDLPGNVPLQMFSTNNNDGYSTGRGTVFTANANFMPREVHI